ncbi:hypothetical protein Gotur_003365 [Gossypium turneri]
MQDIHLIGGGRVFSSGGGGGGGDRRLRLQHQQQNNQALKCPRCDSLNTKFCYYNNYNLSQPRHFCKSCRRYWTKGGVLRNVPVGGGCRKAKRSKTKPSSESTTVAAAAPAQPQSQQLLDQRKANSHSSSDSSSLIAANSNVAWQQQKMMSIGGEEITGELLDQTMQVELSNLHGRSESGFGPLDWQGCGDQPFFDLPNDVDQSYWSQSQWSDQDHTALYLP